MDTNTIVTPKHAAAGISRHPSGTRYICVCKRTFSQPEFEMHLWVEATFS